MEKAKKNLYERFHVDKFDFWTIVSLLIVIVCLLFIVYPFLNLIVQSFHNAETNAFTLENYL